MKTFNTLTVDKTNRPHTS